MRDNKMLHENDKARNVIKAFSTNDFRSFGLQQIAYIRPVKTAGTSYYQICSADGEELMNVESLALAKVITRQQNLEPLVVQ
ncbi:MAG: hypothetical protein ACLFP8_06120 [Alphaproteobacteria bacterium]